MPELREAASSAGSGVVLTGMGSSHYAAFPTWRRLIAEGPAWWVSTSEVLDSPAVVRDGSLVWITSQSGRSGEVVELVERLRASRKSVRIIATTNDLDSPLAQASDVVIDLSCGAEATVSTKSYVNTLAAHALAVASLTGDDVGALRDELERVVGVLPALTRFTDGCTELAARIVGDGAPRMAFVGFGAQATTALTGALVMKEAAKVPAEGFAGGAFRHGPLELADPGLTVLMFPTGGPDDESLVRLAQDLAPSGTNTVAIGPETILGATHVPTPLVSIVGRLCTSIVPVYHLSVAIARATGIEPGSFSTGQKVTSSL